MRTGTVIFTSSLLNGMEPWEDSVSYLLEPSSPMEENSVYRTDCRHLCFIYYLGTRQSLSCLGDKIYQVLPI